MTSQPYRSAPTTNGDCPCAAAQSRTLTQLRDVVLAAAIASTCVAAASGFAAYSCHVETRRLTEALVAGRATIADPSPAHGPPREGRPPELPNTAELTRVPGIVRVGANHFKIQRAILDRVVDRHATIWRQVRIRSEAQNGHIVGIRFLDVWPASLLGALGIEDGDILRSINGVGITSPEDALHGYAAFRAADSLRVRLQRGGKDIVIVYDVE